MRQSFVLTVVSVLTVGCASGSGSTSTTAGGAPSAQQTANQQTRSSYVISSDEIAAHKDLPTAYDLVRRLRPMFKGTVYLDNIKYGKFESMRQLSALNVREIRQLNEGDAALKFGTGAGWVILISSR